MSEPGPLYDLALSIPWCITGDALEAILSIAAREPLPGEEIARRMHGPKSLALRGGQRREDSGRMTTQGPVAVIPIDGPIQRYADMFVRYSGGVTTESLARDLQAALDDPGVSAILLAIDSPGGEATGINELSDAIYAARGVKPIAAYIEGYGASAAYWIASAADLVVVDDTALVGSIGTVLGVPDPTKRPSTRIEFVSKQSPKKRPDVLTAEGRQVLQQLADDMTEVFITKVARNRGLDPAAILAIEGGMLVGQQAVDAGLADAVGSEERTLRALITNTLPMLGAAARPQFSRSPTGAPRATAEEQPMPPETKQSFWSGFWTGAREAGIVPEHETAVGTLVAAESLASVQSRAEDDARTAKIAAENEELRKQLAKVQAERITADAEAWAKGEISAGRAYAAEQSALMTLYAKAAQADAAQADLGLVPALKAAAEARPANRLASNLLPNALPAGAAVLANSQGGDATLLDEAEKSARAYAAQANGKR